MSYPYEVSLNDYLKEQYEEKNNEMRSPFSVLMDVWGEANHATEIPIEDKELLKKQLNTLHSICCSFYENGNFDDSEKEELKIAEWELNDYLLGKNERMYSKDGVMSWFNQWCYQINYNFL